ncbi:iron(III) transport system substrate-binding protein [Arboricoccus pini]|uniref:Iron(III) transport system substrate-binding protein n=1 Tax=Arboricoccus pini TaxID=1963835 RepID=A0A212RP07_9PROT|nr:ABC transporter substrate-binding protein [Arboricoccus pini]SNB74277.1 iron(III) transport system substrate-binding protein [Arboricoccus pini]
MLTFLAGVMAARAEGPPVVFFPASTAPSLVLDIAAATDLVVIEPLIRDFQTLHPEIAIRYRDFQTTDLFSLLQRSCAGDGRADLALSSAVDELVKLANDGCALAHTSPGVDALPSFARWRNEVIGVTYEPAVIVYNRLLVPPGEVPHSRAALIDLLRTQPKAYDGLIGSYDIERAAVGYLLASFDAENSTIFGRLLEAFGRSHLRELPRSADLLAELADGKLKIAYNVLGSYAYRALLAGAPIGIVLPRDYVLVLRRGAMIPKNSAQPRLAAAFIDYLLSPRGQATASARAFYFTPDGPLPRGVEGTSRLSAGDSVRSIPVGPELLAVQDRARRKRFLGLWRQALGKPLAD